MLGSSVFVHPTAPVYSLTAFAAVLVVVPKRPRSVVREAWPGAVALLVTFVPYYASTLGVLGDRYALGSGGQSGRTFTGNPVWVDAVHAVAPMHHDLNWLSAPALAGLVVLAVTSRWRAAVALGLIVLTPIVFFSEVPANGLSAIFFDRYMLPALPAFMLLVAVCLDAIARWAGGARLLVLALLVAGLITIDVRIVLARQHQLGQLELGTITSVVRGESRNAVLFSTVGTQDPAGYLGAFNFGRPPSVFDRYLGLRIPSLPEVDDDTCVPVVAFLAGPATPRVGLWVFYYARDDEGAPGRRALSGVPGTVLAEPLPHYLVVRTTGARSPRALVTTSLALRRRWHAAIPGNPRSIDNVNADSQALRAPAACRGHGFLDDPDISPNWPEALT